MLQTTPRRSTSLRPTALPTLLSTRLLVYGGQISFSLYMIHEPVHTAWNWAVQQYAIVMPKSVAKLAVVGLIAAAIAAAMLLYHVVEEPARRWMRRMVDFRDGVESREAAAKTPPVPRALAGKSRPAEDGANEPRPVAPSVRTG